MMHGDKMRHHVESSGANAQSVMMGKATTMEMHHQHLHHHVHHDISATKAALMDPATNPKAKVCRAAVAASKPPPPHLCSPLDWKPDEIECKFGGFKLECDAESDKAADGTLKDIVECELKHEVDKNKHKFECAIDADKCVAVCEDVVKKNVATFVGDAKVAETVNMVLDSWKPLVLDP